MFRFCLLIVFLFSNLYLVVNYCLRFYFAVDKMQRKQKLKKKKTLNIVTRKQKNNLINIKY
jgi:preprotein translocase subunit YajC